MAGQIVECHGAIDQLQCTLPCPNATSPGLAISLTGPTALQSNADLTNHKQS
jgi:hypothetical protein